MNELGDSASRTSKVVSSSINVCNPSPKKPTKAELNLIKKALRDYTKLLIKEAQETKYGWEDAFNPLEIDECIKTLGRQVDRLDFQVEVTINANKKFFSKIADVIESNYLSETK
ncbi:hypothetical protein Aperf_G00000081766 [Anoplocephala perfoliata]